MIVPIARECARHEGDLWIVYMGNNEMVGPFGAATVFGAQAAAGRRFAPRWRWRGTRLGQAMMTLSRQRRLHKSNSAASWGGMSMFVGQELLPGDPRRERVYRNFRKNLRDIVDAGLDSGAKVLLSTVAVNLKDCPPFLSPAATNLSGAAAFHDAYAAGCIAQERGDFAQAAKSFEAAAALDPQMADNQYRWGQCLLKLTNAAAREHLQLACDDDALPFRADSRINGAIRDAAPRRAAPASNFVTQPSALAGADGVCGQETFYEHVHFNFQGAYRFGLLWASQLEEFLPANIKSRAHGDWASEEICDRRIGLTDWNRGDVYHSVLDRYTHEPLASQWNNASRTADLQAELAQSQRGRASRAAKEARALFEDDIARAPEDYYLREDFGEFLELAGRSGGGGGANGRKAPRIDASLTHLHS